MSDIEEKEDPLMGVIRDLKSRPSVSKYEEELIEMFPEVKCDLDANCIDFGSEENSEQEVADDDVCCDVDIEAEVPF